MGNRSVRVAAVAVAVGAGLVACGGSSNVTRVDGAGGSVGEAGAPGFDTSRCFTLKVGFPIHADLDPVFSRLAINSWIGTQRTTLFIGLAAPAPETFDLSTPENLSWSLCTQCVSAVREDTAQHWYQAQSGTVELTSVEEISSGRLSNLLLREVTVDEMREATVIEDGECIVLEEAEWQTAPCEIGGACPADMECLGSYLSTEAACVPRGEHAVGERCDYQATSTDCAAGLACTIECTPTCDYWNEGACPADYLCNGDSRCIGVIEGDIALGEPCQSSQWRYCAAENGRYAGACVPRGNDVICARLCRTAQDDCAAGEVCEPFAPDSADGSCNG
jgi:hypothetical protein